MWLARTEKYKCINLYRTNASEKSMELANASSILLLQGAKSESYVDVVNFGLFSSIVNLNLYRNIYAVMVAILVLVSVLKYEIIFM